MTNKEYVLITPAKNEENYIEKTIQAVISQTILPLRWIIVNDGSVDRTNEIVSAYAGKYKFIQVISNSGDSCHNFGSKVKAFNAGYKMLGNFKYNFIGNIDADVSFNSNYFERILKEFECNPRLGIGGGVILELQAGRFNKLDYDLNSVAGAVQLFRRRCYDDIGGYVYSEIGGIDAVAEGMARMNGWEVKTFSEIEVYHHRPIGIGTKKNIFTKCFRYGLHENLIGNHPVFVIAKGIKLVFNKPYFLGGLLMICGYLWSWIRKDIRPVPNNYIKYIRSEQKYRIMSAFSKKNRTNAFNR